MHVKNYFRAYSGGMEEAENEQAENEKSPPDLLGGLGLSIDFNECVDEFYEPAKVLPFVRPAKRE